MHTIQFAYEIMALGAAVRATKKAVPRKLKNDAIVEAVFEIRFSSSTIPEILFGRISEFRPWKHLKQVSLPLSQFPVQMRQSDPNLRYQPVFALMDDQQSRAVRVGANAISYSRGVPYVGWAAFRPELEELIDGIFEKTDSLVIDRLGLRYLNALRRDLHGIDSLADLDFSFLVEEDRVTESANVNFTSEPNSDTASTIRVATTDFVVGQVPPGTSVYVDVDVFTNEAGFETRDREFVNAWIERAHTKEKEQFFRLLKPSTIEALREE